MAQEIEDDWTLRIRTGTVMLMISVVQLDGALGGHLIEIVFRVRITIGIQVFIAKRKTRST